MRAIHKRGHIGVGWCENSRFVEREYVVHRVHVASHSDHAGLGAGHSLIPITFQCQNTAVAVSAATVNTA